MCIYIKAIYPVVSSQRNLLSYTENLSNAAWNSGGATLLANNTTAPDGTNTAWRITRINTAFQGFSIRQNVSVISSTQYTFSVYLKAPNTSTTVEVDLGDGTATPTITLTTDWQLYTFRKTLGGSGAFFDFNITSGDGSYCWFWHPQLELRSTATAYQPTLGLADDVFKNSFKFNLVNPTRFSGSFTSGWTFSPTGMTPNGTSAYMDTSLIPSTSLSESSAHLSFYSRSSSTLNQYEFARGNYSLIVQYAGGTFYVNLENTGAYAASTTNTDGKGFYIGSRLNNTTVQGFKNSSKVINAALASTLSTQSLYIGGNGLPTNYSSKECAFASIGDGLSDTDAFLFYLAVQRYQTLLNRQV